MRTILITCSVKKVIYIAVIGAIAIFGLQGLWIGNMYRAYVSQAVETVEKAMSTSIGKEIVFRRHSSPYKDPKHPKVLYKAAEDNSISANIANNRHNARNVHRFMSMAATIRATYMAPERLRNNKFFIYSVNNLN